MKPVHLEHFLTVADKGSISRAAQALELSQPALAKSIRRLESSLGVALFERLPRGICLTAAGETLARHAKLMRLELQQALHEIKALRGGSEGHVAVGASATVISSVLPRAVADLVAQKPGIRLRITTGLADVLVHSLRQGDLDLVIAPLPDRRMSRDIRSEPLLDYELKIIARAGHPLASRHPVMLHDLLGFPWVLTGNDIQVQWLHEEIFGRAGLDAPTPAIETNSFQFAMAHLLGSDALSFLAAPLLEMADSRRFVALDVPEATWRRQLGICYRRRGSLSAASKALVEHLKATCKAHHLKAGSLTFSEPRRAVQA